MGGDLVERARLGGSILKVAGGPVRKDKINGGRDVPPGRLYGGRVYRVDRERKPARSNRGAIFTVRAASQERMSDSLCSVKSKLSISIQPVCTSSRDGRSGGCALKGLSSIGDDQGVDDLTAMDATKYQKRSLLRINHFLIHQPSTFPASHSSLLFVLSVIPAASGRSRVRPCGYLSNRPPLDANKR